MGRKDQPSEPKQYAKISFEKREELIRLVQEEGFPISQAGEALEIKLSTAKLIISRFRKDGTIFQRKMEGRHQPRTKGKAQRFKKTTREIQVSSGQAAPQICELQEDIQQTMTPSPHLVPMHFIFLPQWSLSPQTNGFPHYFV